ncbi:MAG: sulfatase-like hydrolase/transferase [Verrucomicrobiales bacterium]|nr:sulfatase-like hydrolase/transferase [Verrucomicrobiales bacterium]
MRLFLFFTLLFSAVLNAEDERPNIVVILCDDLGYGDLGCYGHPHIKTPHLDKMAEEGIRYTACYSSAPVCSPSRVGLLTGRSPNRAGVYDWIPEAKEDAKRPDNRHLVHLKKDAITIPKLLGEAGYETCLSGKWHCNAMFNSDKQAQPNDAGFDHWFATQNNASPSHENPRNYVRNGEPVGPLEGYSCQLATDEAIRWMKERGTPGTDQKPFFLYLAFHEPHEPVASPAELVAGYKDVARNENEAQYFANVENVDLAVGRVLKELQDTGKDKNTIVFFTSDNGPETLDRYKSARRSYGSPDPLRGMKLWTTDAGFRVCGIASWPGTLQGGQVVDAPVSALDLLPSFCELGGVVSPENLDGISLIPGGGIPLGRTKPLIWCYYNSINEHRVAMRDGNWKVLAKLDGGSIQKTSNLYPGNADAIKSAKLTDIEIYQISEDIGESNNLAEQNPEKLSALTEKLEEAYRELIADSPVWTR